MLRKQIPLDELAPGALENPVEFRNVNTRNCMHIRCSAYATHRVGILDACGRHTSWAINAQVEKGGTSENLFIGVYYR